MHLPFASKYSLKSTLLDGNQLAKDYNSNWELEEGYKKGGDFKYKHAGQVYSVKKEGQNYFEYHAKGKFRLIRKSKEDGGTFLTLRGLTQQVY